MNSLHLPEWNAFIRWHEVGQGAPILCLPGLSMPAVGSFLAMVTRPAFAGRRIIMLDYLGSGRSDTSSDFDFSLASHARSIAAVLEHLGLTSVDIIGHSMGGSVAIQLALDRPDLVGHIVLGEANVTSGGGEMTRSIAQGGLPAFLGTGHAALIADLTKAGHGGKDRAAFLAGSWSQADPRGLYENSAMLVDLPEGFADRYLALPHAKTFVYCDQTHPHSAGGTMPDAPDPVWLSDKGVAIVTVPDAAHSMFLDNPGGAAPLIAGALADG